MPKNTEIVRSIVERLKSSPEEGAVALRQLKGIDFSLSTESLRSRIGNLVDLLLGQHITPGDAVEIERIMHENTERYRAGVSASILDHCIYKGVVKKNLKLSGTKMSIIDGLLRSYSEKGIDTTAIVSNLVLSIVRKRQAKYLPLVEKLVTNCNVVDDWFVTGDGYKVMHYAAMMSDPRWVACLSEKYSVGDLSNKVCNRSQVTPLNVSMSAGNAETALAIFERLSGPDKDKARQGLLTWIGSKDNVSVRPQTQWGAFRRKFIVEVSENNEERAARLQQLAKQKQQQEEEKRAASLRAIREQEEQRLRIEAQKVAEQAAREQELARQREDQVKMEQKKSQARDFYIKTIVPQIIADESSASTAFDSLLLFHSQAMDFVFADLIASGIDDGEKMRVLMALLEYCKTDSGLVDKDLLVLLIDSTDISTDVLEHMTSATLDFYAVARTTPSMDEAFNKLVASSHGVCDKTRLLELLIDHCLRVRSYPNVAAAVAELVKSGVPGTLDLAITLVNFGKTYAQVYGQVIGLLHMAAVHEDTRWVQLCLELMGSDPCAKNQDQQLPIEVAITKNNFVVAQLILHDSGFANLKEQYARLLSAAMIEAQRPDLAMKVAACPDRESFLTKRMERIRQVYNILRTTTRTPVGSFPATIIALLAKVRRRPNSRTTVAKSIVDGYSRGERDFCHMLTPAQLCHIKRTQMDFNSEILGALQSCSVLAAGGKVLPKANPSASAPPLSSSDLVIGSRVYPSLSSLSQ